MGIAIPATAFSVPNPIVVEQRSARLRPRPASMQLDITGASPGSDFENIAMLAARSCGVQCATINFVDHHGKWSQAMWGGGKHEEAMAMSMWKAVTEESSVLAIGDASVDPRFNSSTGLSDKQALRFFAGLRIADDDGTTIGALCVFDPAPRLRGITQGQRTTLQMLAGQIRLVLKLRRSVIDRDAQIQELSIRSAKLQHMAEHDVLTGLPHRELFNQRLRSAMEHADRRGTRVALLLVDIDHFKQINDSMGHDAGDALLCSFAERLRNTLGRTDCAARLGGDEFGILLSGIKRHEDLAVVARSLSDCLSNPITYRGRAIDCPVSIGLAIYPDHAPTPELLTKCSDLALAEAKQARGDMQTFHSGMVESFERETKMLSVAGTAVAARRIVPYYQPKIDFHSGRIVGFEALARYDQTRGPLILPEMFALAFADRKLSAEISHQMLSAVLDDIRAWVDQGVAFGHIAINSCAADFSSDDIAERLLGGLEARGLSPSMMELEVTEGVFLGRGAHHVKRALSLLSGNGMRIALDDFGTGYASLIHLKEFPVDVLKIDRSFVAGIGVKPDDTAIVRALIGLGNSLGIETVAEGIETQEQADFVTAHGCDIGQGFLYSPAQPSKQIPGMIARLDNRTCAS